VIGFDKREMQAVLYISQSLRREVSKNVR